MEIENKFRALGNETGNIAMLDHVPSQYGNAKWRARLHIGRMRVSFYGPPSRNPNASIRKAMKRYQLYRAITGIHYVDGNWRQAANTWSMYLNESILGTGSYTASIPSPNGSGSGSAIPAGGSN